MAPHANNDPFDDLLTLEDTLYTTAHSLGVSDGAHAGRIEGRIFGLERGFDKFLELGELHGRGAVWGSRLPASKPASSAPPATATETASQDPVQEPPASTSQPSTTPQLPTLRTPTTRLQSNICLLYHLTDPLTFSTSNTEASVGDFDDRVKRAGAKAKVIERIIGETSASTTTTATSSKDAKSPERKVRLEGEAAKRGRRGDDSMEDFVGSRLIG